MGNKIIYQVKESDLIGDIEGFPIEVVQKMVECQVAQGIAYGVVGFQEYRSSAYGFDWYKTVEPFEFWYNVIHHKKFDIFFERYPKEDVVRIEEKDIEDDNEDGIIKMKPAHIYFISFGGTTLIARYKGEGGHGCQHEFYSHLHYWNGCERYHRGGYCVHTGIEEIREATDSEKHTLFRFETAEGIL